MASSNRHWPSMFKSKPHQWQQEVNSSLVTSGCHRSQYSSGCEERTPEPKPRWNPKPEQIRILEAIFDSGMVNPPRDEIRKIRAQLQEYGQVGDANVFYWFQNRKSRSKHKLRHLQNSSKQYNRQLAAAASPTSSTTVVSAAPTSSSSSSDNKSSPKGSGSNGANNSCASTIFSLGPSGLSDASNNSPGLSSSLTAPYFPSQDEILTEPFFFPTSHGFLSSEPQVPFHGQLMVGPCGSLLLNEIMAHGGSSKKVKMNPNTNTSSIAHSIVPTPTSTVSTVPFLPSLNQACHGNLHSGAGEAVAEEPAAEGRGPDTGAGGVGAPKLTVFINDVPFEVSAEPFNVRAAFGDDAVLINAAGRPIVTDDWGLTLQPLQHGAFYYLI